MSSPAVTPQNFRQMHSTVSQNIARKFVRGLVTALSITKEAVTGSRTNFRVRLMFLSNLVDENFAGRQAVVSATQL